MTTRLLSAVLVALTWLTIVGPGPAQAQYPYNRLPVNPYQRPVFSPYLNLLRGGNPALNYYGIVRPELRAYDALQQLNQQLTITQQQVNDIGGQNTIPMSGHPVFFNNLSHYFSSAYPGAPTAGAAMTRPQGQARAPTTGAQTGTQPGSALGGRPNPGIRR
jgi:hypothetical protein